MKQLFNYINDMHWGWALLLIFVVFVLLIFGLPWLYDWLKSSNKIGKSWKIEEKNIKIGSSTIKTTPIPTDKDIAYRLWIELTTRKLAQPLDKDNDIILDIYKSWYQFFGLAREILKEIPSHLLSSTEVKEIIFIVKDDILNGAMRTHLTQWQGKYRKWYNDLEDENKKNKTPQQIQSEYNEFQQLINSMETSINIIVEKSKEIEKILGLNKGVN